MGIRVDTPGAKLAAVDDTGGSRAGAVGAEGNGSGIGNELTPPPCRNAPPGKKGWARVGARVAPYWPVEARIFLGLWLALLWIGRSRLFYDPGTFWHIVVGQRIWSSGHLVRTDPFSFTFQGQAWFGQEWLGECALALLHSLTGFDGVLLATATLIAALYAWVASRCVRAGVHPLLAILVVALALAASATSLHPRPNLATVLFLGITFAAFGDFEAGRWPLRRLFWLIPLYALWTNLHGGMLGGLGTMALVVAGWAIIRFRPGQKGRLQPRQLWAFGLLLLACGLTTLVNPYGIALPGLWVRLIRSTAMPELIQEHAPLYRMPGAGMVLLFGAVYLLTLLSVAPRRWRITWLLPLVWFYLTWTRCRHCPLFAITAALALADMLPEARWVGWLAHRGSEVFRVRGSGELAQRRCSRRYACLACGLTVVAAAGLQLGGARLPLIGRGWVQLDPTHWPVAALNDLRAYAGSHPPGTPVFNDMLFGGFLIYHTPSLRVFIDDRCELYGDQQLRDYAAAAWHDGQHIEVWRKQYGFDLALVTRGSAFESYLQTAPHWQLVRRCQAGSLYHWVGGVAQARTERIHGCGEMAKVTHDARPCCSTSARASLPTELDGKQDTARADLATSDAPLHVYCEARLLAVRPQ